MYVSSSYIQSRSVCLCHSKGITIYFHKYKRISDQGTFSVTMRQKLRKLSMIRENLTHRLKNQKKFEDSKKPN